MKKNILSLELIGLLIIISAALTMAGGDLDDSGNASKETDFVHVHVRIPVPIDLAHAPIEEVADEFRDLRKVKGHFDGGEWKDEVDK